MVRFHAVALEMVVPASAVSIGNQAFYDCSGLATVTMNEGLKTIGNEVFWNNSGVMQFSIPGTVTSMGTNCFYGCTRTTYLTFRDGQEPLTINNSGCRSSKIDAKAVNLSNKYQYTNRNYDYFYDCPIRFLTLGRNLTYSYSHSVSTYDLDGSSFKSVTRASAPFINSQDLRSVKIGKYVTFLWHHLIDGCSNVDKLTFPDGLESVYSYALANCPKIATLDFPNPLVLLDDDACLNDTGLTSVTFNEEAGNNLSFKIGDYTFRNCPGLTSLTFPAKTTSVGNYCFYDTENLTSIVFVDSDKAVTLGYGANSAKSMTPNQSNQTIPLFGNSHLQSLYMGRNINYNATSSYGYSPFHYQTYLTDVRFSQAGTVTYCKDYLLYMVNNCKELTLPESLASIGNYTFSNMTTLEGITIPNKVTTIGTYAFSNDKSLVYANLSTSCPWLREGLFADCDVLASITIPPVVTKMDTKMFRNCGQLATVTFEDNTDVLEMGYGASQSEYGLFRDCPVETLYLGRWLSYNTDKPSRSPFYSIAALKDLSFGDAVGVVDKYMFSYCTGLENLYLPDNIESVGLWGFRGCSSLKDMRFSEKLSQVSDYGFSECTSLDNVVFPASMTSIADNSFSNCTSLKKINLGTSLMIIGPAAFKNDTALEGIEIPESLYGLGVEAFANCTSLPNVTVRAISSVGKQAFQGCSGLQWVSLSDKTTSLGEDSFAGCSAIKYVKSYAEFPPEGLVNFPEDVVAAGTLFVPEYSTDYYEYSPTWETWGSIRPITDNVLVSSVSLSETEVSLKATEMVQLTATVGADDATDKDVRWRSSDSAVAEVDGDGLVTALSVGEAVISAIAAYGSGEKAECAVTVLPTMVESIAVNVADNSIKKGRTLTAQPTVLPATATNAAVVWSSSDDAVATVNDEGIVTALAVGEVSITATAADGSGITGTVALTVIPPTKGDSNDNDEVTITDAVNTANYAIGIEVENFNFGAADVNADNRITLADASGTVTELLNQPAATPATLVTRRMACAAQAIDSDNLVIGDYSCESGETVTVDVTLDDTIDYVALQADITVPEDMTLVAVQPGTRVEATHSLMQRRIDSRTMRVVLFNLGNSAFADNGEAIMHITVKADRQDCGDITMTNILACDINAREYVLKSTGGHNDDMSGIGAVYGDGLIGIASTSDGITVINADGKEVYVYAVDGALLARFTAVGDVASHRLTAGVYVVVVDDTTAKVIVK
ncbi:MAG: leucine-rich repeat protein [Pseudoflavonifractor sp.]|nr:leucine-rich repeat protein [Pseudoflavonifractor sp.]